MLKSFHIVGSDGDEGKVPATDLFVVGTFLFLKKKLGGESQ